MAADRHRVAVIEEHPVKGKRLGRHIHFDEQSRSFAVSGPAPDTDVLWRRLVKPYDQGNVGCCTIMGLCGVVRTRPFSLTRPQRTSISTQGKRLSLYMEETADDSIPGQYPQEDTGSTVLDAMKEGVRRGFFQNYEWAFSADQAVAAIHKSPIEVGVSWYEGFDRPNGDGVVKIAGSVRGGHAFEILGRINTVKYGWLWVAQQSWGPTWPQNPLKGTATFGIPDADFHRLREENGEVARPVPVA